MDDRKRGNEGNDDHYDAPCGVLEPEEADDETQHSDAQRFGAEAETAAENDVAQLIGAQRFEQ